MVDVTDECFFFFLNLSEVPSRGNTRKKFEVEFIRYIDESTKRFLPGKRGKPAKNTLPWELLFP